MDRKSLGAVVSSNFHERRTAYSTFLNIDEQGWKFKTNDPIKFDCFSNFNHCYVHFNEECRWLLKKINHIWPANWLVKGNFPVKFHLCWWAKSIEHAGGYHDLVMSSWVVQSGLWIHGLWTSTFPCSFDNYPNSQCFSCWLNWLTKHILSLRLLSWRFGRLLNCKLCSVPFMLKGRALAASLQSL